MSADAEAGFNEREPSHCQAALRFFFHLFFFAPMNGTILPENVNRRDSRITRTGEQPAW